MFDDLRGKFREMAADAREMARIIRNNGRYVSVGPDHRPGAYELLKAVSLGVQGMWNYRQQVGGSFSQKICLEADVPENHPCRNDLDLVAGTTPAMIVAQKGWDSIRVFRQMGGEFDRARDAHERDAGWFAAKSGVAAMKAFVVSGGRFTDAQEVKHGPNQVVFGDSTLMLALRHGEEGGRLYMDHGGKPADLEQVSKRVTQTVIWKRSRSECMMGMGRGLSRHVVENDEIMADAASIALAQGIDTAKLYVENGGRFQARHLEKVLKTQDKEIFALFSQNGGGAPANLRIIGRAPVTV